MPRMRVDEYLAGPEQTRPLELVWGVLHEPPAPRYGHQSVAVRTLCLLAEHVRAGGLGKVCVAPAFVHYRGAEPLRSAVLPGMGQPASAFLD